MNGFIQKTIIAAAAIAVALFLTAPAYAQRVKDIARPKAAQENAVKGLGLVVGLSGTGDGDTTDVQRMILNFYRRHNIEIMAREIKSKNVAVVQVETRLRADVKEGMKVDVYVASMGSSKSLKGGRLLETWLRGVDGKVYVIASGPITPAKEGVQGSVKNGGIAQEEIPVTLSPDKKTISWVLEKPDYSTSRNVAIAMNKAYDALGLDGEWRSKLAKPIDASEIVVTIPPKYKDKLVTFLAILSEQTVIGADVEARVVINSADQSIAINGNVRIGPCLIAVEGVELNIPGPPPGVEKVIGLNETGSLVSLSDIRKALNLVGVTNKTLIQIIKRLDEVGALYGKVVEN